MKKRLAVVVTGWHYPYRFYDVMVNQKKPSNWDIDFYVIGHRDPEFAKDEKDIKLNSEYILDRLDCELYKKYVTISDIKNLGWKYESGSNGWQWEGSNHWLQNNDYSKYDVVLFSDDDNYIVGNELFDHVLGGNISHWFENVEIRDSHPHWGPQEISYDDDWLVVSNAVQPGRPIIRGSFEFLKAEVIDLMGGQFPISDKVKDFSEKKKNDVVTPENAYTELGDWNDQVFPFMSTIWNSNLYNKFRFLSYFYRISNYIIEGERGYISSNKVGVYSSSYLSGVEYLESMGRI